jgi:hypothetical protein
VAADEGIRHDHLLLKIKVQVQIGGTMPPIPNFGEMLMRGHASTFTDSREIEFFGHDA